MAVDEHLGIVLSQLAHYHFTAHPEPASNNLEPTMKDDVSSPAISVIVSELPAAPAPPKPSRKPEDAAFEATPGAEPEPDSSPGAAPGTFPYFPLLPAELRLKIWHMSFLPRTVELHTRRAHYANDDGRGATPKWQQSQSRNPAALGVNAEARAAALEFYTVTLPLHNNYRVLYLNLEHDTVVLLGDLHYTRLTKLLDWFRAQDRPAPGRARRRGAAGATGEGKGLRKLAMSVALWAHEVGAATLKAFARTVFADMDEFTLFMYPDRLPPPDWTGGSCVLEEADADADYYRRFIVGRGRQFRVGDGWMVVGQQPMKVAELSFEGGW
ncbi:hypothetical protein N658DRAFT_501277 [Parathielavia hyrcaniae]|uniref:2EXR domain-containing protein n=1 Tax=Parathielavia hyrcaniae TaxID=113614 RepID=A0AAN6PU66_9PEZI|nr:hypothetical protein N658DRAFT_501277 [Parathielavia hyrcaniae]